MHLLKNQLVLFFLLVLYRDVGAQPLTTFTSVDTQLSINSAAITTFSTPDALVTINDIIKMPATSFKVAKGVVPTYFVSNEWHWIKFKLVNQSDYKLFLEVNNITIESIQTYVINGNSIQDLGQMNWSISPRDKILNTWRNIVPLNIDSGKSYTICLKVYKHLGTLKIPIIIWSEKALVNSEKEQANHLYFFSGLAIIVSFICLLVYLNIKEKKYFFYTLYVLSMLLWRAYIEGYLIDYVHAVSPNYVNPVYGNIVLVFVAFFHLSFVKEFLLERGVSNATYYNIYYVFVSYLAVFFILFITIGIDVFSYRWYGNMYLVGVAGCVIISLTYIVAGMYRKKISAFIYLISMIPLWYITIVTIGTNALLLPASWQTGISVFDTLIFEIAVLSIGLAIDFKKFVLEKQQLLETVNRQKIQMYITQNILNEEALKAEKLKHDIALEKEKISRDLHDNIGSELANIAYSLEYLNQISQAADHVIKGQINYLQNFVRTSIMQLRNSIWVLNQENIELGVFTTRLTNYLSKQLSNKTTINYTIHIDESIEQKTISAKVTLNLFRIVQELVANTLKHASATNITLLLVEENGFLTFIYEDDGVGLNREEVNFTESYGLSNMQKRAQEMLARFEFVSSKGAGVKFKLIFNKYE